VAPVDPQAVAATLADASSRGQAVAPVGSGTALGLGNPPERLDVILSTARLGGVIDYEPSDLVLSIGAGAQLGDVQAILGEFGQRLPIDPPGGDDATIGGLIATARWGPLRHSAGTLRDYLIGISVAHPSGTVSRAGGMVVKNVSGYDMPRLYLGSLGTLGVIVSANFKVLPRPRAESTVVATYPDRDHVFAASDRMRSSMEPLAALEVIWKDSIWQLAARVEGREQTVAAVTDRIEPMTQTDMTRLDGTDSLAWWTAFLAGWELAITEGEIIVRCGVRPKETATLVAGIVAGLDSLGCSTRSLAAAPGLGTVLARIDFGPGGSAEALASVQDLLLGLAEAVTILSAPAAWKTGIDVWGRLPDGFDVMRTLRNEFDPHRTINPGRFAGFL
jgi:glycolate oxidase FAD binding subunit